MQLMPAMITVECCCLWLLLTWLTLDDGVTESSSSVVVRGSVRLDESNYRKAPRSPSKSKKFNFFETKIQYQLKVFFFKINWHGCTTGPLVLQTYSVKPKHLQVNTTKILL
jgi:hypothetical protein